VWEPGISLYWSGKLQSASAANEILDDSQRSGSSVVEEQSCPTWYRETKYNGVGSSKERMLPWRPAFFWAYFQTKQQLTLS